MIQVIDFPSPEPTYEQHSGVRISPKLTFDPEWLAITRAFHPYFSTTRSQPPFPGEAQAREMVEKELDWVVKNVKNSGIRDISECQTFVATAPGPGSEGSAKFQQRGRFFQMFFSFPRSFAFASAPWYPNPQTGAFCAMLQLENKIDPSS